MHLNEIAALFQMLTNFHPQRFDYNSSSNSSSTSFCQQSSFGQIAATKERGVRKLALTLVSYVALSNQSEAEREHFELLHNSVELEAVASASLTHRSDVKPSLASKSLHTSAHRVAFYINWKPATRNVSQKRVHRFCWARCALVSGSRRVCLTLTSSSKVNKQALGVCISAFTYDHCLSLILQ